MYQCKLLLNILSVLLLATIVFHSIPHSRIQSEKSKKGKRGRYSRSRIHGPRRGRLLSYPASPCHPVIIGRAHLLTWIRTHTGRPIIRETNTGTLVEF